MFREMSKAETGTQETWLREQYSLILARILSTRISSLFHQNLSEENETVSEWNCCV
jgi:hypothetical protein